MAKPRLKTAAAAYVSQSRDGAANDIRQIGDLSRELTRLQTAMNDEIAETTSHFQPGIDDLRLRIQALQSGVQTWCEAHRAELTEGGRVKTANLITGEIAWRNDPPSVGLRGVDKIIEMFRALKLTSYLRQKAEVDKEAILADRATAAGKESPGRDAAVERLNLLSGVAGVTLNAGVEKFVITPFEQEAT